jgi:HD superfamily phosphohydrolase
LDYAGLFSLIDYVIDKLSEEVKTVRDPIHGDIVWNSLETQVIDTETFQRLRRIKQLGTAHLVFPGAEHSRFQHSIGTLHMTQTLLNNIKNNKLNIIKNTKDSARAYKEFGNAQQDKAFRLIVRLSALLHDVQEFPLSHTLEKEGNLFSDQWKNETFNRKIFGVDVKAGIYDAIYNLVLSILSPQESGRPLSGQPELGLEEKKQLSNSITRTILSFVYFMIRGINYKKGGRNVELKEILRESRFQTEAGRKGELRKISMELFETEDIIENLSDTKFLVAGILIVSDTVCSDLLDYLPRDFYFCGIKKTYDERFLKCAIVGDLTDEEMKNPIPVFAYNLMGKRDELKNSVLSSLFDTLELRYTIAEVAHTHKTKNAFSAMVIEAFNYYYQLISEEERREFDDRLMQFGDDELLSYLRKSNLTSGYILDHYYKRRPYRGCIIFTYKSLENREINDAFYNHVQKARERLFLEKLLIEMVKYDPLVTEPVKDGDILLYAMPNPERLFKELKTNVKYKAKHKGEKIGTLSSLTEKPEDFESNSRAIKMMIERTTLQRNLLQEKFNYIWNTSLFLSPDLNSEKLQPIISRLVKQFLSCVKCDIKLDTEYPVPELLCPEVHSRFWKLADKKRSWGSFEEMFNNIREKDFA